MQAMRQTGEDPQNIINLEKNLIKCQFKICTVALIPLCFSLSCRGALILRHSLLNAFCKTLLQYWQNHTKKNSKISLTLLKPT